MASIRDLFLGGVYNSTYEVLSDGGPTCYRESTLGFKFLAALVLLPWHLYVLNLGVSYIARHHEAKK